MARKGKTVEEKILDHSDVVERVTKSIQSKFKGRESVNKEITTQYREIMVGDAAPDGAVTEKKIRIRFPNIHDDSEIGDIHSRVFGELIEDEKMKTEDQIIENMKKRGVWSDIKDKRIESLVEKEGWLTAKLLAGSDSMTKDEAEAIATQYEDVVAELQELRMTRYQFMQNSIESRSNDARTRAQLVRCVFVVDEEGKEHRLWKTDEDLMNEKNRFLINRIVVEALSFWNRVPSSFLDG